MKTSVVLGTSRPPEGRHPGVLLRDHVLPGLGLSISQAARDLGISRQTLHRILDSTASITPEMAARLETLCGVPSMFWMQVQCAYDLGRAQTTLVDVLAKIPKHVLPLRIIRQLGALDGQ